MLHGKKGVFMNKEIKPLQIKVSESILQEINEMKKQRGMSLKSIFILAFRLLKWLLEKKDEGYTLCAVKDNEKIEVFIPF